MSRVIKAPWVQMVSPHMTELTHRPPLTGGEVAKDMLARAEEQVAALQSQAAVTLSAAEQQAQALIRQAQQEAAALRQSAEQEAAKLTEQAQQSAREHGYQEGWQAGLERGRKEASQLVDQARETLRQAETIRAQRLAEQEEELIGLALTIARKVIGQELTSHPDALLSVARAALAKAQSCSPAVMRVAPPTLQRYREQLNSLQAEFRGLGSLEYLGDPLLGEDEVLIDTPYGTIDARIDTQLDVIRSVFHKLSAERPQCDV